VEFEKICGSARGLVPFLQVDYSGGICMDGRVGPPRSLRGIISIQRPDSSTQSGHVVLSGLGWSLRALAVDDNMGRIGQDGVDDIRGHQR